MKINIRDEQERKDFKRICLENHSSVETCHANDTMTDALDYIDELEKKCEELKNEIKSLNEALDYEYPREVKKYKPPTIEDLEAIKAKKEIKRHILSQTGPGTGVTTRLANPKKKDIRDVQNVWNS